MSGLKHHLHGNINPGQHKNFNHIADPMDRHTAYMTQMNTLPFCKSCGKPILMSTQDEDGVTVDPQWEAKLGMHTKCYNKVRDEKAMDARAEQARLDALPKESLEDIIKRTYGLDVKKTDE
jgi:hypothetical protein